MITLLSNSPLGVCEWSVSEEVEIAIRPNGLNYRRWKGNEFSYGYCIN